MALYAIGDLHLSLGADKPMDVFGGPWENYVEKSNLAFRPCMTTMSACSAAILPGA